jgi:hypothetical protein
VAAVHRNTILITVTRQWMTLTPHLWNLTADWICGSHICKNCSFAKKPHDVITCTSYILYDVDVSLIKLININVGVFILTELSTFLHFRHGGILQYNLKWLKLVTTYALNEICCGFKGWQKVNCNISYHRFLKLVIEFEGYQMCWLLLCLYVTSAFYDLLQ